MNILITGGKGQLASELIKNIKQKHTELGEIPEIFHDCLITAVDVDELDISDKNATIDFVNVIKPDVIINCAAITNVDSCEENKDLAFKVNSLGTRNLAEACEQVGAKLIHISTDYVFEGNATKPYLEWDICNPQSVYGKSKSLGEKYITEICSKYFIIRTSWLYGYIGNNFVKTILNAAKKGAPLKVVDDQRGNPTNAADLSHHIFNIAASEEYGIYHCTGEGECSWFDFASKIVEYANIDCVVNPCTTDEFPRPAKRPEYSSLDNMMLRCTVGNHMRIWQDALKYFIENLNK